MAAAFLAGAAFFAVVAAAFVAGAAFFAGDAFFVALVFVVDVAFVVAPLPDTVAVAATALALVVDALDFDVVEALDFCAMVCQVPRSRGAPAERHQVPRG